MRVICISGKAQNGKDTTAGLLKEFLEAQGKSVLIAHYGDLVKYVCRTFFNWNGEKDEYGRTLLQHVGTDIIRNRQPNYWVNFIRDILKFFPNQWDYVLIPDSRFPNEIDFLRDQGFNVTHIRVSRPNFVSPLTAEQQRHPSETALDESHPDYLIQNLGSINDLSEKVADYVRLLLCKN